MILCYKCAPASRLDSYLPDRRRHRKQPILILCFVVIRWPFSAQ